MPPKRNTAGSASLRSAGTSKSGRARGGADSAVASPNGAKEVASPLKNSGASSPLPPPGKPRKGTAHRKQRSAGSGGEKERGKQAGSPNSGTGKGEEGDSDDLSNENVVIIPSEEQLMEAKRLQAIADQLSHSLTILRTKLSLMKIRVGSADVAGTLAGRPPSAGSGSSAQAAAPVPLLPFQIRRAQMEREQMEIEIHNTSRTIQKLLIMSQQIEGVMGLKDAVFAETKEGLEAEIAALQAEKAANMETVREGYVSRINLLHRYWPWRQLLDLGDTSVGGTFEEELKRGPRYRHVAIQNSIESDYIAAQLQWLEQFSARDDAFRSHLRRLDALVEDLHDINDLLQSTLSCQVCGMLFEEPVIFWPCGHTFCKVCFESLMIAPSLFRCPVCGSIGSEGYVHNLLVAETVAKWMFKDSGYGDLHGPLSSIRVHLSRFRKDRVEERIKDLKDLLKKQKAFEKSKGTSDTKTVSVSYRAY